MTFDSVLIGIYGLGIPELLILVFVIIGIGLLPLIFYLLTLQNTLKEVSIENRKMPPEQVWLCLIPLFGTIWQFIIVNRMADSLKSEFIKRNINATEERPGFSIGIAYCVLNCCTVIPFLGVLSGLAGLICWIIYWTKISGYKLKLQQNPISASF